MTRTLWLALAAALLGATLLPQVQADEAPATAPAPAPAAAKPLPEGWTSFGHELGYAYSRSFIISYPGDFIIDPASGLKPSHIKSEGRIKEVNLHSTILHNPEGTLQVRATRFGKVDHWYLNRKGLETAREIILYEWPDKLSLDSITRKPGYQLFVGSSDTYMRFLYLFTWPDGESSYQTLSFTFKKGTRYADHIDTVQQIVEHFIPGPLRTDLSPDTHF